MRVATLDCRRVGRTPGTGRFDVDSVVNAVHALGAAPDILGLSGTIGLRLYSSAGLLALTRQLNELLPAGDFYYPFLSERPGTRNPPALWLSARHVEVVADHQLPDPTEPRLPHEVFHHTVETVIAGGPVWLKAVQWQESDSPQGAIIQSVVDSQLARLPSVLLGSFAASLASDQTPSTDWADRQANADALERVLRAGFWDAGQVAAGVGQHLCASARQATDHILVSHKAPARLVPDSFIVGDVQAGVACDLDFEYQRSDDAAALS